MASTNEENEEKIKNENVPFFRKRAVFLGFWGLFFEVRNYLFAYEVN